MWWVIGIVLVSGVLCYVLPNDIGMAEMRYNTYGKCCRHCPEEGNE